MIWHRQMVGWGDYEKGVHRNMYHFEYVSRKQAAPVKKELIEIIHAVQNNLRDKFTFRYDFVGSASRNMITQDVKSNIGFDFDINIEVNDDEQRYSPKQIREMLKKAFDRVASKFGYSPAEQSTRVLTIKVKDKEHSKILHSCDVAVVNNYIDDDGYECQEYIHFDKKSNKYLWEERSAGYYQLSEKETFIKKNIPRKILRDLYLQKKNTNKDPYKKSRTIYAEAVHEICQKNGYYD